MNTNVKVLNGITLVMPLIEIWSGTVKFDPRQVVSDQARGELPPTDLASDGRLALVATSKKLASGRRDTTPLGKLLSGRKAADRILYDKGFRLMGGFAVPTDHLDEVMAALAVVEKEFTGHVNDLVHHLPDLYTAQEKMFPQWEGVLRKNQIAADKVRSRCKFDLAVFEVGTPADPVAAARLEASAKQAYPALLDAVAMEAEKRLENILDLTSDITQRSVTPIRELIAKLESFSFLDGSVEPLVTVLRGQLSKLPNTGKLDAGHRLVLVSMLQSMSDPDALIALGRNQIAFSVNLPELSLFAGTASPDPMANVEIEVLPAAESIELIAATLSTPAAPARAEELDLCI